MFSISGCFSVKSVKTSPVLLRAYDRLTANALVERVNARQAVTSIKANASIRVTDLKLAEQGKIEPYHPADGLLVLSRPESIRLLIRVPIIKQNIADMTSDGEHFRIAIHYPEQYRRFLVGSNNRNYEDRLEQSKMPDPTKQKIGSFVKIRPQHLTEALLIRPINISDSNVQFFTADLVQTEHDEHPGQPDKLVDRTYQVLYVLERVAGSELRLTRQFWFDRTQQNLPLSRMQIFEPDGSLSESINYKQYQNSNGGVPYPQDIEVVRASDSYSLALHFETFEENTPIDKRAFLLENTDNLPEKDLDSPTSHRVSSDVAK